METLATLKTRARRPDSQPAALAPSCGQAGLRIDFTDQRHEATPPTGFQPPPGTVTANARARTRRDAGLKLDDPGRPSVPTPS